MAVVDTAWAADIVELDHTVSPRIVFLIYVAENLGLDNDTDTCEVAVWLVTSDSATGLNTAGKDTFLSVSDRNDPSEVTSWAKFTPATETARATLEDNVWIDIGCANADEVAAAEGQEEEEEEGAAVAVAGTGTGVESAVTETTSSALVPVKTTSSALVPVGTEPNASRMLAVLCEFNNFSR